MAFTGGYFEEWIVEAGKILLGLAPLPVAAESELLLFIPPAPITGASALADVLAGELAAVNGYARFNLGYVAGDVTWDGASNAAAIAQKEWTLTATGGPIQWQGIAMVVDSGGANERLVAGYVSDVLLTIPDGTSHTFQWSMAHFNTIVDSGNAWT
jgi:hypothetical protein